MESAEGFRGTDMALGSEEWMGSAWTPFICARADIDEMF